MRTSAKGESEGLYPISCFLVPYFVRTELWLLVDERRSGGAGGPRSSIGNSFSASVVLAEFQCRGKGEVWPSWHRAAGESKQSLEIEGPPGRG